MVKEHDHHVLLCLCVSGWGRWGGACCVTESLFYLKHIGGFELSVCYHDSFREYFDRGIENDTSVTFLPLR